jgi:hypothetical protein
MPGMFFRIGNSQELEFFKKRFIKTLYPLPAHLIASPRAADVLPLPSP